VSGRPTLLVRLNPGPGEADPDFDATIGIEELSRLAKRPGALLSAMALRQKVTGRLTDLRAMPKPLLVGTVLRLISAGPVRLEDREGRMAELGWGGVARNLGGYFSDRSAFGRLVMRIARDLDALDALPAPGHDIPAGPVTYLKPDLWLGSKIGGAVAHSAGIVNALEKAGRSPLFAAFEANPIIDEGISQAIVPPPSRFWNISEAPMMAANAAIAEAWPQITANAPSVLYARVSAFHYSSSLLARRASLPVVLEYNGSEPWIARNWGAPFRHEALARRIEDAVLRSATRIAVVSEPLREELLSRGIEEARIVVQPNAVDPERFNPGIDGSAVKRALGFEGARCVFGFIGSFGRWHGIAPMIEAFAEFSARSADDVRLVVIGDGAGRAAGEDYARELGAGDRIVFTGAVAQTQAPACLAACDVLLAPHINNPDGSMFFGSPTKLFEYMAMGRAIVASRLGQIAEILEDERTALLVPPGDVTALAAAMERIAADGPLRERLGAAARQAAVERHDWRTAVERIFSPA
jgi:glycosyltransferase involved in cell wall biosynthesis